MSKIFNSVKLTRPKANVFDRSHEKKLSCNMAELVPILLEEVVPGDKFRINSEIMMRMAPMIAPIMHRVNVYTHFFFVPNRLVYTEWEDFITGGENGLATPVFPTIPINDAYAAYFQKGMLSDYFGIPIPPASGITSAGTVSALPFRAYQLIYNEYYRDQNLVAKVPVSKTSTVTAQELVEITLLRKRAWEKDYFTSAQPNSQKGGEVLLPMDNQVNYDNNSALYTQTGSLPVSGNIKTDGYGLIQASDNAVLRVENIDSIDTQLTINELRRATRLQQWLERNQLGGSRYIESILAHFGVRSSDSRLQRPLYLGGGKSPVQISEVLSTVGTEDAPQGAMSGHGISFGSSNQFKQGFEEHGYIIGILSTMPRTAYSNGMPKEFTKFDKFDYPWPEFAHLGEQPVKNGEVYYNYKGIVNGNTFGYQSRYAEYKFKNSSVHGDFRDDLAFYHMGREFDDDVALNQSFIEADPTHRIFAVTDPDVDKLYVQIYNDVRAIRLLPFFGTPML